MHVVQGRYEARGRSDLAREWFDGLDAPAKTMTVLGTSGHRPLFEQADRFSEVMTRKVLGRTPIP